MIKFCSLSSGSKGNSAFIEINGDKYLIDIGNSCHYVENALKELMISPREIKGIFISHSHKDHIEGLKVFIKKYNPVVYLSNYALDEIKKEININNYCLFDNLDFNFNVTLIPTSHDVKGSYGFVFDDGSDNDLVYITDTGYISEKNLKLMENKKLYYFESNHDVEMLMNGPYPYYLKQRILSDKGHLSNKSSAYYLHEIIGAKTKTVILAHLSETNNNPDIALKELEETLKEYNQSIENIFVGEQNKRGELIEV